LQTTCLSLLFNKTSFRRRIYFMICFNLIVAVIYLRLYNRICFIVFHVNKRFKYIINTTLSEQTQDQISKFVEWGKIDTPNTQIYGRSLSWLGTGTSVKSGGVKLVLWTQKTRICRKELNWNRWKLHRLASPSLQWLYIVDFCYLSCKDQGFSLENTSHPSGVFIFV
jgi:hypothetical protein